jgi:Protein of unknown function (DUF1579)
MKNVVGLSLLVLLALVLVATTGAQGPSGPPKPGPEHEKLSYFVGKWASEGDMKPGPFGPGGKATFIENCEWYEGKFAVVCKSEGEMAAMKIKGLEVMGYDQGEKTYTYFETNTMGENVFSRGTVDGDTWTWTGESKMEGKPVHTRFTLKRVSQDTATYKFEMSTGSDPLAVIMEGKQTRQK